MQGRTRRRSRMGLTQRWGPVTGHRTSSSQAGRIYAVGSGGNTGARTAFQRATQLRAAFRFARAEPWQPTSTLQPPTRHPAATPASPALSPIRTPPHTPQGPPPNAQRTSSVVLEHARARRPRPSPRPQPPVVPHRRRVLPPHRHAPAHRQPLHQPRLLRHALPYDVGSGAQRAVLVRADGHHPAVAHHRQGVQLADGKGAGGGQGGNLVGGCGVLGRGASEERTMWARVGQAAEGGQRGCLAEGQVGRARGGGQASKARPPWVSPAAG